MITTPVYFDYNATTPVDPAVLKEMMPFLTTHFGNAASRSHIFGWEAAEAVDEARQRVARLIGAEEKEIIFTSGATESINLALKGVFEAYKEQGNHLITLATEHKATLDTCAHLEKLGAEVTYLPVGADGMIDLQELESAFRPTTMLVSVMFANNETGVIQPMKKISEIASRHGAMVFSDATQAVGKIPVAVNEEGIDLMAFSAHKMYGPKGVGALYVRRKSPRVKVIAQADGGGHERGMRSGTLNVPGIVGFGKACELCMLQMKEETARLVAMRDKIEQGLLALEETVVNGNTKSRLPHVSNLLVKFVEAGSLLQEFNRKLAISTGSACSSASPEPSHVLKAMGLEDRDANSSLRLSIGRFTTAEELDFALETIKSAILKTRNESPVWEMFKAGKNRNPAGPARH